MADYTNNLNLILPGDDDYALVQNLTDDFQAIDDFAGDVVKLYDPTTYHTTREYCLYQGHIYKCNTLISTPEPFNPAKWDRVILATEIRDNNSYISNMQSGLAIVQTGDTATKAITEGQYVCWKGSMRYAKANIAIGETFSGTNLGLLTTYNGALNKLSDQIANLGATIKSKNVTINTGSSFGEAIVSDSSITKIIAAYVPTKANWFCRCYSNKRVQLMDITDNSFKTSQNVEITVYYI